MSRIDLSTHDLFLRLGSTPRSRSARADKLFRRLRSEEEQDIIDKLMKAPSRIAPKTGAKTRKKSAE